MYYQLHTSNAEVGGEKLSAGNAVTRAQLKDLSKTKAYVNIAGSLMDTVILDLSLSEGEKVAWMRLYRLTDQNGGWVQFQIQSLANDLGVSQQTMRRRLSALTDKGYLVSIIPKEQKLASNGKCYSVSCPREAFNKIVLTPDRACGQKSVQVGDNGHQAIKNEIPPPVKTVRVNNNNNKVFKRKQYNNCQGGGSNIDSGQLTQKLKSLGVDPTEIPIFVSEVLFSVQRGNLARLNSAKAVNICLKLIKEHRWEQPRGMDSSRPALLC